MVEEISPIVFKKIDVSNFAKKGDTESKINQTLFYDNVSKKLIQITSEGIKIFNKGATNLKKDIKLQLNKERIYKIAVDKKIQYMLIFIEKNREKVILIINVQLETVIQILQGDLNKMMGMFFIFNTQTLSLNQNENTYFTLVYKDKIHFFRIAKNPNKNYLESVDLIDIVNYGANTQIYKYIYNPKYMILCVQKEKDESYFDFYNLSNVKFYSKVFQFYLSNQKNDQQKQSVISNFLSYFSFPKKDNNNDTEPIINNKENYKVNHFFLETLYNKLYFIFLNYDESFIQLYHVKTLYEIKKVYEIQFENENICTLQFIDNLILVHNFDKCETTVIDLKSKTEDKVLYKNFPISSEEIIESNKKKSSKLISVTTSTSLDGDDFSLDVNLHYNYIETESMLSYTNTIFYTKNMKISGGIIEEKCDDGKYILYDIYFDPMIYFDKSSSKIEALINLTRRKNGKEAIIHGLYEMIKSGKNVKLIKGVFSAIIKQIVKNKLMNNINTNNIVITKEKENISMELMNKLERYRDASELPIPFQDIFLKKKNLIIQTDIYYKLFKSFEFKTNIKFEYIVNLLVYFYHELKNWKVKVHSSFHSILVLFLKKIQNFSKEYIIFQFHSVPDSIELANFLLYDISLNEFKYFNDTVKKLAMQQGIDMLTRLNKYNQVFSLLVKTGQFASAVEYSQKHKINFKKLNDDIINKFKRLAMDNLKVVNNYIEEFNEE